MTDYGTQPVHTPTALLAEDDTLIRELVSAYLERLGYTVLEASNGQDAIEHIEKTGEHPLDLIVTDLLMPKANGQKVIAEACSKGVCERFLVMSGNPLDPRLDPPRYAPNSKYIEKPFSFGDFEAKVRELIA